MVGDRDTVRGSETEAVSEGLRLRQDQRVRDRDRIRWLETELGSDGRRLRYR